MTRDRLQPADETHRTYDALLLIELFLSALALGVWIGVTIGVL